MSVDEFVTAVVLGIVEGLTEFVPISSTGHLIVAGRLLGFEGEKAATFEIFIQLGAILAVALLYRERLRRLLSFAPGEGVSGRSGWVLLAITSLPALILGALLGGPITDRFFNPTVVAIGWGLGGVALLGVERGLPPTTKRELEALRWPDALAVGLAQCLALWPGVSRAAATMGGAMLRGVDRRVAAEYSFLAAMPILAAASLFGLYDSRDLLSTADVPMFAVGFVVSFLTALVAVRFFVRLLGTLTLRPFAWYRIGAAAILLVAIAAGWVDG